MLKAVRELEKLYKRKKLEIKNTLDEFKKVLKSSDERIFAELAFCICTPQSKATLAWNAISSLVKNNLLYTGNEKQIRPFLSEVRFAGNKVKYIIGARKVFTTNNRLNIKQKVVLFNNSFELRDWLVKNIKGIGLKEASHFIRNIGFDYDNQLAILDRHILKNLRELGVIKDIQKSLTRKRYLEIEERMKSFAKKLNLSLYELDILFWSEETGIIFK